jgi:hypothetical protein
LPYHERSTAVAIITPVADLLERAAQARRLAIAIDGDPAALRLFNLAEVLDAESARLSRLE